MNKFAVLLAANLGSLACIVGAILLALNDKSGWGWFLITGFAMSATTTYLRE